MYKIDDKDFKDDSKNINLQKDHIFNIELEGFNGPLDLLLALAKSKKLDVSKMSILSLVDQYLDYIKKIKKLNLDIASDYLVMAAVLAYIKSKLLLPGVDADDDNKIDLPEILEFNLKRLSAIREKTSKLFKRDILYEKRFLNGKIIDKAIIYETEYYCNFKNLVICFANTFNRKQPESINVKKNSYYTTEFAINKIRELYKVFSDWTSLSNCLPPNKNKQHYEDAFKQAFISTVCASLELAKKGELLIKQNEEFGEIFIKRNKNVK